MLNKQSQITTELDKVRFYLFICVSLKTVRQGDVAEN